ncbi:DUF6339 family protein [Rhodococcus koreensis]|uniref:Uncharacterized protein n=1 Tax=Rhodococcus koreensis TaxID=99653 RepID=A0A1H4ZQF8_9NOCA|nr:DUF6339 family protein [Rhodococcus koreensis]SED32416.1 hypothetical protein SAMN04490239_7808 [Rhodococcus koreensis]
MHHAIPEMLGFLSNGSATKHLSRGIQAGLERPPIASLTKDATYNDGTESRWRAEPVRELLVEAMDRFESKRASADGWLAPRLHATLRLTRAEAAEMELWNYIALVVAPDYVVWRHKGTDVALPVRFSGPHYTQAFARLWWAAELFRNGEDYRPVEVACQVQDVLNTTMRLDVIDHRPTALAIIHILEDLIQNKTTHLGDHINALSSAVNTAGSTVVYDVLAPDLPADDDAVREWISEAEGMSSVPWDRLPDGPADGTITAGALHAIVPLFENLLAEAPRRKRPRHAAGDDGDTASA